MPTDDQSEYSVPTHTLSIRHIDVRSLTPDDIVMHYSKGAAFEVLIRRRAVDMRPPRRLRDVLIPKRSV